MANQWVVENYYITDGRVLTVEITIPLIEFLYVTVDDVREAWIDLLNQIVQEEPGVDVSWTMIPRQDDALVTIKIAKSGNLEEFTPEEMEKALDAMDALFDKASA